MKTLLFLLPIFLAGCATPVRSTVDGYGEASLARDEPLYFDRDALPLAGKPVSDSCRDAAREQKLQVSDQFCPSCKRVQIRSRLAGTSQSVTNSGPSFGTSVGLIGGSTAFGIGLGSDNLRSEAETQRVIDIGIFDKSRNLLRSITVRSIGPDNSVAAVAYEMCMAAFKDYPANLKGKTYEIKPGGKPK